jgi:RNA-directed DNA polymerase
VAQNWIAPVSQLKHRGYRPFPLRRISIPKKNGKKRPLSIPVMKDRAMQALHKLALEPVAETTADPNSYGFRPLRSCADAVGQCFITFGKSYSPQWVIEGDIKACFDEISHEWLLSNILMDRKILSKWLKAGYIDGGKRYPTYRGTPQGGIISPVIANMTLDGLERTAVSSVPGRIHGNIRSKVNVIRYADDFIVTGANRSILKNNVMPAVEAFLAERGLTLSGEKTRITRIEDGFDFLGQNIRKYGRKLLIKPARDNVRAFLDNVRETIKKGRSFSAPALIGALNPKLRGWANFHRHIVAGKTFGKVDTCVYEYLWQWMRRKHKGKRKSWLVRKYWSNSVRPWTFSAVVKSTEKIRKYELIKTHRIGIQRHVKIRGKANPYDPEFLEYFKKRKVLKGKPFSRFGMVPSYQ